MERQSLVDEKAKNLNIDILCELFDCILNAYDSIEQRKHNIRNSEEVVDFEKAIQEDDGIKGYQDEIYYLSYFYRRLKIEGIIGRPPIE